MAPEAYTPTYEMPAEPQDESTIEERVNVSIAVRRYLRSAERYSNASKEFTVACKSLRKSIGSKRRFVVNNEGKFYLVTSDQDQNFDVEEIESF